MKYKLFRDISFNTLQVLVNQFLGVFIFLLISRYLDKPAFGELSWSLAVLTFIMTILSLRLEQVIVRNVAAGGEPSKMLSLFMMHNLITGTIFFLLLSAGVRWLPVFFNRNSLLWILSISQLLGFFSLPFRQVITGRAAFGWLVVLSSIANLIRAGGLLGVVVFSTISLQWVLILFTFSALAEFIAGAYIVFHRLQIPYTVRRFSEYKELIKSSFPQVGMVVLNAGIARMDWILLGIFSTPARTAEYSFAYKAFELSPLPLLIVAPLLLNYYSRSPLQKDPARLNLLIRWEMVLATLLPLLSIIAWSPLADALTHNKYGQVNEVTFLILCFCIPFQYLINIHWSREFAQDRLGRIFTVTAITALVILAGDLLLIPLYAGRGAAIAFLAGMIVQYLLYCRALPLTVAMDWGRSLLIPVAIAVCSGLIAVWMTKAMIPRLLIASGVYAFLIGITGRFRLNDWSLMKDWVLGKKMAPSVAAIREKTADKILVNEVE